MNIFVRENLTNLFEELLKKLVNFFFRRIHWSLQSIFRTCSVVAPERKVLKRKPPMENRSNKISKQFLNPIRMKSSFRIWQCWSYSVSRPGFPGSKDWVCPGVSNSLTTRIPRRRAYLQHANVICNLSQAKLDLSYFCDIHFLYDFKKVINTRLSQRHLAVCRLPTSHPKNPFCWGLIGLPYP